MAHVFEKLGARKGDRISFMTHNCLTYIYSWLGACKIGCVANPLNFMLKPHEIEYIANDAGSRFFFVEDVLVPQALEAAPDLDIRRDDAALLSIPTYSTSPASTCCWSSSTWGANWCWSTPLRHHYWGRGNPAPFNAIARSRT